MTPAVISVLTKGLSCGHSSGCEAGTSITAGYFTLWCGTEFRRQAGAGGGVAHPNALTPNVAKSTAATLTTPHSDPDLIYIDPNKVMGKRVPVKLIFKMGEREIEKIYTVSVSKADVLIKVMNLVTTYKKKMSVSLTNLTRKNGKLSIIYTRGRAFISKRRDFD